MLSARGLPPPPAATPPPAPALDIGFQAASSHAALTRLLALQAELDASTVENGRLSAALTESRVECDALRADLALAERAADGLPHCGCQEQKCRTGNRQSCPRACLLKRGWFGSPDDAMAYSSFEHSTLLYHRIPDGGGGCCCTVPWAPCGYKRDTCSQAVGCPIPMMSDHFQKRETSSISLTAFL